MQHRHLLQQVVANKSPLSGLVLTPNNHDKEAANDSYSTCIAAGEIEMENVFSFTISAEEKAP